MSREVHVRICEGVRVRLPHATRLVVLCNGTKAQALETKEELKGVLLRMGLTLSEEKTKVTHIPEGFTFLGYRIERRIGTSGKMGPKVLIPDSAIKRFRHKIREIVSPSITKESVGAKIVALNSLTRGWCEYYRCTSSPSIPFSRLNPEGYWGMAYWLGHKYKENMTGLAKRFGQGSTWGTKTMKLKLPSEYKAKNRLVKTWHNPYTSPEKIDREKLLTYDRLWNGRDQDRHVQMDQREAVIQLKGTICAMCGKELHPYEAEIDHIKLRAAFKDPKDADHLDNLQVLCTECHRAKTKTDLKVLSRMR